MVKMHSEKSNGPRYQIGKSGTQLGEASRMCGWSWDELRSGERGRFMVKERVSLAVTALGVVVTLGVGSLFGGRPER
jgi:hypothetical protein